MRRDGFDPKVVSDKLYFLDCTKGQYVELNVELYRSIASGKQKLWDYYQPPPVPSSPRLQQPSNPAPSSLRPSLPQQTQWRAAAKHSGRVFKSSFIHSHSPPLLWPRRNWGGIQPGGHIENKTKKMKQFIIQEYKKNKQQGTAQGPNTGLSDGKAFPLPQLHNPRLATGFGTETCSFWWFWQANAVMNVPSSPDQTHEDQRAIQTQQLPWLEQCCLFNMHQIYLSFRVAHHLYTSRPWLHCYCVHCTSPDD